MNKYWSGLVAAGAMATTVALGAQSQNPANTPPPDAGAQPGTQRTAPAPGAQTRGNTITLTGCLASSSAMPGAAGAAGGNVGAGNTGAGNSGAAGTTTTGDNRGGATTGDTSTGRTARPGASAAGSTAGQAGASANMPGFMLNDVSMGDSGAAGGVVGTSGRTASTYRLQGDAGLFSPHLNRRVRVTGRMQDGAASSTGAGNAAPGASAAVPTFMAESVTMIDGTCPSTAGAGSTQPNQPRNQDRPNTGGGNQPNQGGNSTTVPRQ